MKDLKLTSVSALFLLILSVRCLFGQAVETTIEGSVLDEKNNPVPSASVIVEPNKKGTNTNAEGKFRIKNISPGRHTVKAVRLGYEPERQELTVRAGEVIQVTFHLKMNATVLEGVTVRATREVETIQRMPEVEGTYIVAGVKNEVIQLRQSDANVVQNYARSVFAKVPGVFVYEYDGSGNAINVATRGLDPHRSWEFNIRMNDLMINSDLYGYPANHFNMPLEAVERIQLIRGSASLQYGAQFGGMLNYVLNSPDTSRKFSFHTQISRGSYDFFNTFNEASGKIGKLQYYTYYSHRSSDTWRDNAEYTYDSWHVGLKYFFRPDLSLKAEVSHMNYINQLPGALNDSMFHERPAAGDEVQEFL